MATTAGVPVTVIRPQRGWARINLGELWSFRELLGFLVWRDLKVRYRQAAIGAAWAVIQPALLIAVFTLILGRLSGIAPAGIPYSLFVVTGLLPWLLFARGITAASESLVNAVNLIQKVYFPRLLLPIAALGAPVLDFFIGTSVLGALMAYHGVEPSPRLFLLLPFAAYAVAVALAFGVWLAAANAMYRDIRQIVPFMVQVWFFATPVAYGIDLVPAEWRWAYSINPMSGVVEGFRAAIIPAQPIPTGSTLASGLIVTGAVLGSGLAYFRRAERTFADVI